MLVSLNTFHTIRGKSKSALLPLSLCQWSNLPYHVKQQVKFLRGSFELTPYNLDWAAPYLSNTEDKKTSGWPCWENKNNVFTVDDYLLEVYSWEVPQNLFCPLNLLHFLMHISHQPITSKCKMCYVMFSNGIGTATFSF